MGLFDADERFGHDCVYQAILVYPALARLEHFYPHHITHIHLVGPNLLEGEDCEQTSKRLAYARDNSHDSGVHSNSLRSSLASPTSHQDFSISMPASTPKTAAGVGARAPERPFTLPQPGTVDHHITTTQPGNDAPAWSPRISTPENAIPESRIPQLQRQPPLSIPPGNQQRSYSSPPRCGTKIPISATSRIAGGAASTSSESMRAASNTESNSPTNSGPSLRSCNIRSNQPQNSLF